MPRSVPKYRRQRRKNRQDLAFCEIKGERHCLGVFDSKESREAYAKLIASDQKPASSKPRAPEGPATVARLLVAFLKHAQGYYVDRDGQPSREYGHYLEVIRLLRVDSELLAESFGPKRLKAVRDTMISKGWTRGQRLTGNDIVAVVETVRKQLGMCRSRFVWTMDQS